MAEDETKKVASYPHLYIGDARNLCKLTTDKKTEERTFFWKRLDLTVTHVKAIDPITKKAGWKRKNWSE